jgi:hypothetical protein
LGDGEAGEGDEKEEGGEEGKREALLRFMMKMARIVGDQDGRVRFCCAAEWI